VTKSISRSVECLSEPKDWVPATDVYAETFTSPLASLYLGCQRTGVSVALLLVSVLPAAVPRSQRSIAVVTRSSQHDTSIPLRLLRIRAASSDEQREHERDEDENQAESQRWIRSVGTGRSQSIVDRVAQSQLGTVPAPAPLLNFPGLGGQGIPFPPDANGAVGPHHYVQVVNGQFAVYSKVGALVLGPVNDLALWKGFQGACADTTQGDPVVLYDKFADRWVLARMAWSSGIGRECIAVSRNGDPTDSWHRYEFSYPGLTDTTKIGVWPSAYILS